MMQQLLVGSLAIIITICIEAVFFTISIRSLRKHGPWLRRHPRRLKTMFALVLATLWLLAAMSAGVWVWAILFDIIGAFPDFETSLYFSVVSFTTLGFGDIILGVDWRLLSGMCAANGLIVFGINTAFLVEFLRQMSHEQDFD